MSTEVCEHLSQTLLKTSYRQLSPVQQRVIDAVVGETPTGESAEFAPPGFWDRLADDVARVGGSWGFIFAFGAVLFGWMLLNSPVMKPLGVVFDPYPYIFLNLMLSTLAAVQAPIIMMSQNRSAAKDRLNAEHDYVVNLRAEVEILRLHDRLDDIETRQLATVLSQQAELLALLKARVDQPLAPPSA